MNNQLRQHIIQESKKLISGKQSAEEWYQKQGEEFLEYLRKQYGRHALDKNLKLIGGPEKEEGFIGNGDMIFVNDKGQQFVATMHGGKDYIKPDKGQMYI